MKVEPRPVFICLSEAFMYQTRLDVTFSKINNLAAQILSQSPSGDSGIRSVDSCSCKSQNVKFLYQEKLRCSFSSCERCIYHRLLKDGLSCQDWKVWSIWKCLYSIFFIKTDYFNKNKFNYFYCSPAMSPVVAFCIVWVYWENNLHLHLSVNTANNFLMSLWAQSPFWSLLNITLSVFCNFWPC